MPTTMTPKRIRLEIAGMSCGACVDRVRTALQRVGGIRIDDLRLGSALLELQPRVETKTVVAAVAAAGYQVRGVRSLEGREESPPMSDARQPAGCCCSARSAAAPR